MFTRTEFRRNSPEFPSSPVPGFIDEDYYDQQDLMFKSINSTYRSIPEDDGAYDGSHSSLESDDELHQLGDNVIESAISFEDVVIDDDYNHYLFINPVDYNNMYNISNHEVLSETSESADMHDA